MPLPKILFAPLVLVLVAACSSADSPETQVRKVIDEMEQAAEDRDVGDLMEHVSASYRDAYGQGPDEASRYLRGYFIANQSIHLLTRINSLEFPTHDEAHANVSVGMVGREDDDGNWNLAAELHDFDVVLRLEDGDWKVRYAKKK